jgi:RNA polymerase sigma-70 factor (ECF subfamily)
MEHSCDREDSLLVAKCHQENEEAFGELYSRHFESVRKILVSKTGLSEQDSLDVVQKAFLKAMRNIKSFKCQSSFRTWIYRIAYNTFLDTVRGDRNLVPLELLSETELEEASQYEHSIESATPSQDIERSELLGKITEARKRLNETQKEIFDLVFVEGNSYKDASIKMNVPVGTIMSRVHYTRKKLTKILQSA